jgi:NAD(P)-dependent dehydrogenase (short-subunit alcohol dehydrogenase family)
MGFLPWLDFYAASKAAISGLSRSFAAELSPRGMRVNVVAPGFTKTPMWTKTPLPPDSWLGDLFRNDQVFSKEEMGRMNREQESETASHNQRSES